MAFKIITDRPPLWWYLSKDKKNEWLKQEEAKALEAEEIASDTDNISKQCKGILQEEQYF